MIAVQVEPPQLWRVWKIRKNRPFIIKNEIGWVYTGMRFVAPDSYDSKYAMPFYEVGTAEGCARHLRMIGHEAGARRSSYDECKRLRWPSIKPAVPGERIVITRFRKSKQRDGSEFWPHR